MGVKKLDGCREKKTGKDCLCLFIQFVRRNCQTFTSKGRTWYLKYQDMIMLRPDCVKNGEKVWVLSTTRITVRKLYFRGRNIRTSHVVLDCTQKNIVFIHWNRTGWPLTNFLKKFYVWQITPQLSSNRSYWQDGEYLFRIGASFLDGKFKNCLKQFAQLYSSLVDLRSTTNENYTTTRHCLLSMLKSWEFFLVLRIMKIDFEAAVVSAMSKIFPYSVITGCNCHFNQCVCVWRERQNIGLTAQCKENEQIRLTCRTCVAFDTRNYQ
jgi:hypothetical protein